MKKVPITLAGVEKLRQELQNLKAVERPNVVAAIAEARSHGDLSENAEYDAAKEKQAFIEGRIKEIEGKLSNAQMTQKPSTPTDAAFLVLRLNLKTKTEIQLFIKLLAKMKPI